VCAYWLYQSWEIALCVYYVDSFSFIKLYFSSFTFLKCFNCSYEIVVDLLVLLSVSLIYLITFTYKNRACYHFVFQTIVTNVFKECSCKSSVEKGVFCIIVEFLAYDTCINCWLAVLITVEGLILSQHQNRQSSFVQVEAMQV